MTKSELATDLILLIGSNPIPNFLSVLMFKPKKVWFCYSPQTKKVKKRLESILRKVCPFESEEVYIPNPGDPKGVRKTFERVENYENKYLNYTGGTKVMAAQARMVFEQKGGDKSYAFYIYEPERLIRFDNGKEISFKDKNLKFKIEDILLLHNIWINNKKSLITEEISLSHEIAKYILSLDENCITQKKSEVELKKEFGSKYQMISESFFRRGDWLEVWTGHIIKDIIRDTDNSSLYVSLNCTREGRPCEIDIMAVYKCRIYIVSCTTSHKLERCKTKLFEVALRARQLGGDLARSALVCLLFGKDERGLYIDQLRKDISDFWDAPNSPRVFGLDDLREWIGGRRNSLKDWLES